MKFVFLAQLILVSAVVSVNFNFPYIVRKTIKRDACALVNYLTFSFSAHRYSWSNISIANIFEKEVVEKYPDKVLLISGDAKWTAKQLNDYSNRVANVFWNAGLLKGQVVTLMMENRPEFVAIWLGLSKIGVITALINTNLRRDSLEHCVNTVESSAFIFDMDLLEAVRKVRNRLRGPLQMFCWTSPEQEFPAVDETWATPLTPSLAKAPVQINAKMRKGSYKDPLIYIYTSGTTGLPKAATISNSRYLFMVGAIRYQLGFTKEDRIYTPLPLYHSAGGAMAVGQALIYGTSVVIRKRFSAREYFADIVRYECTIAQYIGEMCRYILKTAKKDDEKNHNLRMIFGNGLGKYVWEKFVERFNIPKVGEFYGATEGNANVVNTDNTVGAVGFLSQICPSVYPVTVIKVDSETGEPVRDRKGRCVLCKPNEPGLIVGKIQQSRPDRAYQGYVNMKEPDKKVINNVLKRGDAAFVSGDIVVFDQLGYLFFRDRIGDTYRWKGENVSTSEVEITIGNCIKVKVCIVYGVEVPGCEGRAGMAAILIGKEGDDDDDFVQKMDDDEDQVGDRNGNEEIGDIGDNRNVQVADRSGNEEIGDRGDNGNVPVGDRNDSVEIGDRVDDSNIQVADRNDIQDSGSKAEEGNEGDANAWKLNLDTLAEDLKKLLPMYAVPLFIRRLHRVEMTGTFKIKKVDLQKQGFDPGTVKDELFYLSSAGKYEPLTQEVYQDIVAEKIRF